MTAHHTGCIYIKQGGLLSYAVENLEIPEIYSKNSHTVLTNSIYSQSLRKLKQAIENLGACNNPQPSLLLQDGTTKRSSVLHCNSLWYRSMNSTNISNSPSLCHCITQRCMYLLPWAVLVDQSLPSQPHATQPVTPASFFGSRNALHPFSKNKLIYKALCLVLLTTSHA